MALFLNKVECPSPRLVMSFTFQAKTEQVINQYNNQVRTLPNQEASRFDNNVVAIETTWDMRSQKSADPRKIAHFLGR